MKVLWLGSVYPDDIVTREKSLSAAAVLWQSRFIRTLQYAGHDVQTIAHLPVQAFPRGRFFVSKAESVWAIDPIETSQAAYLNILQFRDMQLGYKYRGLAKDLIDRGFVPDVVCSYNTPKHILRTCRWLKRSLNVPWISFVADMKAPNKEWSNLDRGFFESDGVVFFSEKAYVEAPFSRKYHFYGGFDPMKMPPDRQQKRKMILYAGMLDEQRDLSMLLDAFIDLDDSNVDLVLCGRGNSARLEYESNMHCNIRSMGFVDSDVLQKLMMECHVFVNPRSHGFKSNEYNFPSKVLSYMTYGKPIVSSWSSSMPSAFKDYLVIPRGNTPSEFKDCLAEVLSWSGEEYEQWNNYVAPFVEQQSWEANTRNLVDWILRKFVN